MGTCKILVACHKPCWLPSFDSRLVPIHCGRAVSNLEYSEMKWMNNNMIGDDTGDNISALNPYFCELTALYWAWKNYERLGAPDQIGLCHYRRFFLDVPANSSLVVPVHYLRGRTIESQFVRHHGSIELQKVKETLSCGKYKEAFDEYLKQSEGYFFNMFVMERADFFDYCNFLFGVLFKLHEKSQWHNYGSYQGRMAGFIGERLTGAYLYSKLKESKHSAKTLAVMPIVRSNTIFSTQLRVLRYLSTMSSFKNLYSLFLSAQIRII